MAECSIHVLLPGYSLNTDVGSIGFCSVLLIEGEKRVLFDPGHVGRRRFLVPALESRGLTAADIDAQFLSHSHWDHVQNIDLFGSAPVLIHPTERRYGRNPHPNDFATPKWTASIIDMLSVVEVGEGYEVMPGCRVFEVPGHSAGSIGLDVETAEGRCLVVGDALPNGPSALSGNISIIFWSEEQAKASVKRILGFNLPVFPGHDRPFRVKDGAVQYLADFGLTLTGVATETAGAKFIATPPPGPWVMPAIEEQTLDRLSIHS